MIWRDPGGNCKAHWIDWTDEGDPTCNLLQCKDEEGTPINHGQTCRIIDGAPNGICDCDGNCKTGSWNIYHNISECYGGDATGHDINFSCDELLWHNGNCCSAETYGKPCAQTENGELTLTCGCDNL